MSSYTWDTLPAIGSSPTMETDIRDTLEQWRQNMEDMNDELDVISSGDVSGPDSSTDDSLVMFDGTTGKTIADSGYTVSQILLQAQSDAIALAIALGG